MPNRDRHQGSKGAYLRIQFGEQEGVSYAHRFNGEKKLLTIRVLWGTCPGTNRNRNLETDEYSGTNVYSAPSGSVGRR